MLQFDSIDAFRNAIGTDLGWSGWTSFSQVDTDDFGRLTGSDDWIHTDPERSAQGPFGATILQGDLVLSALPRLLQQIYRVDGVAVGLIYGSNRVRLPAVVPVDARFRARAEVIAATETTRGVQFTIRAEVWVDGAMRPSLVADLVHLLQGAPIETS